MIWLLHAVLFLSAVAAHADGREELLRALTRPVAREIFGEAQGFKRVEILVPGLTWSPRVWSGGSALWIRAR